MNSLSHRVCHPRAVTIIGAVAGFALVLASDAAHRRHAQAAALQSPPAQAWLAQAREFQAQEKFQRAIDTANYALAAAPHDSEVLAFQGDMHESLFQFREAQQAYERALAAHPGNRAARENLDLCRRLNRIRRDPAAEPATLYAMHRVMLRQGRVCEAVAVARRLPSDRALQQATWQAALDLTGLRGKVTADAHGALALDLSGARVSDLSVIARFPVTSLNLAGTEVDNIAALRGMRLERLDLTGTTVEDLAPLREMPLECLRVAHTAVKDLAPLAACPLRELDISETRVFDLAPLGRMPLAIFRASDTPVNDLRPLAALPLCEVYLAHTRVRDLTPLSHAPLQALAVSETPVFDLAPLRGSQLRELLLSSTGVSDLRPLAGMPLRILALDRCNQVNDLRPLESCVELEHLSIPPRASDLAVLDKLPRLRFVIGDDMKVEDLLMLATSDALSGGRLIN